jgi:hypothetical protein
MVGGQEGGSSGPSDVAEERGSIPAVLSGAMISVGRLLEKLGPQRYSAECVEGAFPEFRGRKAGARPLD